ncbi:MAG: hypothetical protein IJU82_05470 [Ruminiclostridium sp.]|nr:hypothetical protein [Ruminiclostridium sp.]
MLKTVLSPAECADCRFCCSFRRQSLWETPLFDGESMKRLSALYPEARFKPRGGVFTIDIDDCYKTDDPEEEALCPFNKNGCILSGDDKPFDCSIWPLRVMRHGDKLAVCLTPTCPMISAKPLDVMRTLVSGETGDKIIDYAKTHPWIVKEYKEGFPVLREF